MKKTVSVIISFFKDAYIGAKEAQFVPIFLFAFVICIWLLPSYQSPPQQPTKLKFEFTTQEAETILRGLEALPYRESAPVIQVLITQAQRQSAPLPPTEEKKADSTGKGKPKGKNRP